MRVRYDPTDGSGAKTEKVGVFLYRQMTYPDALASAAAIVVARLVETLCDNGVLGVRDLTLLLPAMFAGKVLALAPDEGPAQTAPPIDYEALTKLRDAADELETAAWHVLGTHRADMVDDDCARRAFDKLREAAAEYRETRAASSPVKE